MELICAIDLLDGGAVRLVQGDYRRRVDATIAAPELARRFVAAGCRRLHVVDLAGARDGAPAQVSTLGAVVAAARSEAPQVTVEAGGGLRTTADVAAVLRVADEAVLGTAAIAQPGFLQRCADEHAGRVAASLDLRAGRPAVDGWVHDIDLDPLAVAGRLLAEGATRLVVTETSRDGTLSGPDLERLTDLRAALPSATLVAAGGIGSLDDLRALEAIGIDGAVVGLALLSGAIDPAEAIAMLEPVS